MYTEKRVVSLSRRASWEAKFRSRRVRVESAWYGVWKGEGGREGGETNYNERKGVVDGLLLCMELLVGGCKHESKVRGRWRIGESWGRRGVPMRAGWKGSIKTESERVSLAGWNVAFSRPTSGWIFLSPSRSRSLLSSRPFPPLGPDPPPANRYSYRAQPYLFIHPHAADIRTYFSIGIHWYICMKSTFYRRIYKGQSSKEERGGGGRERELGRGWNYHQLGLVHPRTLLCTWNLRFCSVFSLPFHLYFFITFYSFSSTPRHEVSSYPSLKALEC